MKEINNVACHCFDDFEYAEMSDVFDEDIDLDDDDMFDDFDPEEYDAGCW